MAFPHRVSLLLTRSDAARAECHVRREPADGPRLGTTIGRLEAKIAELHDDVRRLATEKQIARHAFCAQPRKVKLFGHPVDVSAPLLRYRVLEKS